MKAPFHDASASGLNRASVSSKIFLLVATFSLPIGVLAYLLAANYTPQINTAKLEIRGNRLQRPLMQALRGVLRSQNIIGSCLPADCAAGLKPHRAPVDASLADAVGAAQDSLSELSLDNSSLAKAGRQNLNPVAIQEDWRSVSAAAEGNLTADDQIKLAARYGKVAGQIAQLIGYVGNSSNLILDPDLDSYYLVDVTLLTMPDTLNRIATATSLGNRVLGGASAVERAALANEVSLLRKAMERMAASNRVTLDSDAANHGVSPSLEPALQPALQRYSAAMESALATLQAIADDPARVTPAALASQSETLQQASLDYWNVADAQLDTLLDIRISDFERNRIQALGFSALAVLAAAFLAFLLGRSITRPLNELLRDLAPGATLLGVSVERIAEASRNQTSDQQEAAIICEELNAHAESMRHAVFELARHVQGAGAPEVVAQAGGERKA